MSITQTLIAASLLFLSACTGTAGSGSRDVSAAECRVYYVHIYEINGEDITAMMGQAQLDKDAATCAEHGSVTRHHLDCAMKASSMQQLQECGLPNT